MKLLPVFFFCLILLTGCASHTQSVLPPDTNQRWEQFLQKNETEESYCFKGSLRTGTEKETHRFNFSIQNGTIPENSTLRNLFSPATTYQCVKMDVYTGMGGILANVFVCDKQLLVYFPKENKLVFGKMTPANIRKLLEVSIPMDLNELYALLFGKKSGVDKKVSIADCTATADGTVLYHLNSKDSNLDIGLNSEGKMISWKNKDADFLFTYANTIFPKKINGKFFTEDGTILLYINISQHIKQDKANGVISPEFPPDTPIHFLD